jgi:hypothetical protein
MNDEPQDDDWVNDVPFAKHRLYYMALKLILIAGAVFLALKVTGVM